MSKRQACGGVPPALTHALKPRAYLAHIMKQGDCTMIKFVKTKAAKTRRLLGRIRKTVQSLLLSLDLSLALEVAIPPIFKFKVEIERKHREIKPPS